MKLIKILSQVSLLTVVTTTMATQVNVAHLAPIDSNFEATAVSVNVDGDEILNEVNYRQASGYLLLTEEGVAPGDTLIEVFAPPGVGDAAITNTLNLAADAEYTVAAIGDGNNQPLSLLSLLDDNNLPTAGHAKIRIVHAAPFNTELFATAVSIRTDDDAIVNDLMDIRYGEFSEYFELPAGTHDLNVSTPDGSTRLIDIAPLTLNNGDVITFFIIGEGDNQPLGAYAIFSDGSSADIDLEPPFTTLTPGLNGSWFNQATNGQGFFVEVFDESAAISVAWFTYDTTFPDANETAVVGDSNHRWYTAQGAYNGTSANLTIYLTTGGIFNQDDAVSIDPVGTMTIDFEDCSRAELSYNLLDSGLSGNIPITRIAGSSVAFCESLNLLNAQQ